jgi:hypothetical protein
MPKDINIGANQLDEEGKTKEQSLPDAEKKANDSVDKASDATTKAPKRKGDKDAKDEPGQLGTGKEGMTKFKEVLDALVNSEATLSEAFRDKAATIFEAALTSRLNERIESLEEDYQTRLDEAVADHKETMVEKLDKFLDYVVENWMEENKLAVEGGLRTEIAEGFMTDLKALFVENYIEVPESKVDVVEELEEQVGELTEKLNTISAKNIELSESVKSFARDKALAEACEGLSIKQADRLTTLAEGIDFTSEEQFTTKLSTIKESYFQSGTKQTLKEEASVPVEDTAVATGPMAKYLEALERTNK